MISAVCLDDFETLARQKLPHATFEYIAGGTGDEVTLRWNREAFDRIRLRTRVLENVSHIDSNLDTVPAAIDALPSVAGRVPILLDGGVRRGTDVVKALALGASAVMVGRPYAYALAAAGAEGLAKAMAIPREEGGFLAVFAARNDMAARKCHSARAQMEAAMALLGRPSLWALDRSVLW